VNEYKGDGGLFDNVKAFRNRFIFLLDGPISIETRLKFRYVNVVRQQMVGVAPD